MKEKFPNKQNLSEFVINRFALEYQREPSGWNERIDSNPNPEEKIRTSKGNYTGIYKG